LKRVYSSFNRIAAHHARNLLATEGIEADIRNEFLSSAMGEIPPAECQVEVWVHRDEDAARAIQIVHRPPPTGPDWTCPGCGEASGPQFTQCWKCGTLRPPGG
jgi:hypothetical protein